MSSSILSWQILTAHAQPFRKARDLVFCLKVPLDSLLVWASSEGSGETARMRRLAWTFAARIGYKHQICLTRSIWGQWNESRNVHIAHFTWLRTVTKLSFLYIIGCSCQNLMSHWTTIPYLCPINGFKIPVQVFWISCWVLIRLLQLCCEVYIGQIYHCIEEKIDNVP